MYIHFMGEKFSVLHDVGNACDTMWAIQVEIFLLTFNWKWSKKGS